ncbi:MAG: lipopolysaccharide biosynthesis protein [Bacteroidales bacterium]|jgi:O-antigen/teichoic acid export membrane protein|nr:lipopolysaccharide biosynthesis protein [Bacteroidales bacterium]
MSSIKQQSTSGIIWSTVERFSYQGVSFVLQIIMARLLLPEAFGLVGMLSIFLAISQTFIDCGFVSALIQKINRTETDYSTVFYFNIVISIFCYLILFLFAPVVADFFNQPLLRSILRITGLQLVIGSFGSVLNARLIIATNFKKLAIVSITSLIISGVTGIMLAYSGFGVWALVYQGLLYSLITVILLYVVSKWLPKKKFSFQSFKSMFAYGSKLLASSLLEVVYINIYSLVIGKKFSSRSLGIYSRSDQFAQFPSYNITRIIDRVIFPILSNIQNEDERLEKVYRQYLKLAAFIVFPIMTALSTLAFPVVDVILGKEWHEVVLWLQILCFSTMWFPIHVINLSLIKVKGRSDWFLKLEIIKKILGVSMLFITVPLGITAMCIGGVVFSVIALVINTHYTGKVLHLNFLQQIKDLLPSLIYSLSMAVLIYFVTGLFSGSVLRLITGFITGITYYFLITYITKSKELSFVHTLIKENYQSFRRRKK